ncbi:hypothetical protein CPC08DRAFT_821790 [Agrocybe pediades]|nr:hypothetical protein CPC08DRAFT_821790 [Agrocybe pediades]
MSSSQYVTAASLYRTDNKCDLCGMPLKIKLAGPKSKIPGQFYLHCFNNAVHPEEHKKKGWWMVFGALPQGEPVPAHLQSLVARTPTASPEVPQAATFNSPQHSQLNMQVLADSFKSSSHAPTPESAKCAFPAGCPRVRIAQKCVRHMCPLHCVTNGGCQVHSYAHLSKFQRLKVVQAPLAALPGPSSAVKPGPSQAASAQPSLGKLLEEAGLFTALSTKETFPPTSPLQRVPDNAVFPSTWPPWKPTSASQPVASGSQSSSSQVSSSQASGSQLSMDTPPKNAKITSQMNAIWMDDYKSSSSQAANSPITPARVTRDLALVRRFVLVYWDNSVDKAQVLCIEDSDCPHWPVWQLGQYRGLSQLMKASESAMSNTVTSIEMYSTKYRYWMTVSLGFAHQVTTDCILMIRRAGVTGVDEDDQIRRFFSSAEIPSGRFRTNILAEKKSIRESLKNRNRGRKAIESDSDSDIEFVSPSSQRKRRLSSPIASPTPKRVASGSAVGSLGTSSLSNIITIPDTPPASMPVPLFMHPSAAERAPSPSPSPTRRRWPHGQYAVDVVGGFMKMDQLAREDKEKSLDDRLLEVYGCSVPKSTYYDALCITIFDL